jgi:spermidine/putrescine-binding protein
MIGSLGKIFFIGLSLFITFFSISHAYAGESGVKIYTIEDSIREAFKNNWSIKTKEE